MTNINEEILAVLREIRDHQAQHHAVIMERLNQLDAEAREQRAKSDGDAALARDNIRKSSARFFIACFLAILAFLFLPIIGSAIQSFFGRLTD